MVQGSWFPAADALSRQLRTGTDETQAEISGGVIDLRVIEIRKISPALMPQIKTQQGQQCVVKPLRPGQIGDRELHMVDVGTHISRTAGLRPPPCPKAGPHRRQWAGTPDSPA